MSKPKATDEMRVGCTELTKLALKAVAAATGDTEQAITRAVMHEWALREHAKYTVFARGLVANGLQASLPGFDVASAGKRRSGDGLSPGHAGARTEDAGSIRRSARR